MVYVGVCVLMVIVTIGLAFFETDVNAAEPTPTATITLSPAVQTLQAEGYHGSQDEHNGQGNGARNGDHPPASPEATGEPETTPDS